MRQGDISERDLMNKCFITASILLSACCTVESAPDAADHDAAEQPDAAPDANVPPDAEQPDAAPPSGVTLTTSGTFEIADEDNMGSGSPSFGSGYVITLPAGSYSTASLVTTIQTQLPSNWVFGITATTNYVFGITITTNYAYFSYSPSILQVIWTDSNVSDLLGFTTNGPATDYDVSVLGPYKGSEVVDFRW